MLRKILLIEDSITDAHLAMRVIKKEALAEEVNWLKDGEEALDFLLSDANTNYHLVLLDIKLPKLTGLEILSEMQQKDKIKEWPPIIIFSSSNQLQDIEKAEAYGAAAFYTKPVGYFELKSTLKQLCEQWMLAN